MCGVTQISGYGFTAAGKPDRPASRRCIE